MHGPCPRAIASSYSWATARPMVAPDPLRISRPPDHRLGIWLATRISMRYHGPRVQQPGRLAAVIVSTVAAVLSDSPAWAGFIPGGGSKRSDCFTQLFVAGIDSP